MKCLFCKKDTRVLESRSCDGALRRRRACMSCEKRFTTYERVETTNVLVLKRSGARQAFSREKVRAGILRACEKRPVTSDKIERVLDRIEDNVRKQRAGEITSSRIGEIVLQELKRLDPVAYIRFASVYLDFKDHVDFQRALREIKK